NYAPARAVKNDGGPKTSKKMLDFWYVQLLRYCAHRSSSTCTAVRVGGNGTPAFVHRPPTGLSDKHTPMQISRRYTPEGKDPFASFTFVALRQPGRVGGVGGR